jgi:hypothetical protein
MSMSPLSNKDRENLTAYLDGELDEAAVQALEAKINLDPAVRKEVEALKKTWGLLDQLPKPRPATGFTHRTMERLTLEKLGPPAKTGSFGSRRVVWAKRILLWSIVLAGAVGLGFGAGRLFFRSTPQPKVAEEQAALPPAQDLDWLRFQPKAVREQYARLSGEARKALVTQLFDEERQRKLEWQMAGRFWRELEKGVALPSRLTDFPPDVVNFVTEYLQPVLTKEEKERLEKAQGNWPLYPLTLVELADRHPPALPGPDGAKTFAELPADVKNKLRNAKGVIPKILNKLERTWPGFGSGIADFAASRNVTLPHEYLAWGHACLSPGMQDFVDKKLTKVMDNDDKLRLISAERKWPMYPLAIQEIAAKHNLPVPWQTLPGTRERWENYRNHL